MNMTPLAVPGRPELDFNQSQEMQNALANLVQKRPAALKAKVKCSTLSSKNKDSETSFRQSSSAWGGRLCYLWWPSGMLQNDVDVTETCYRGTPMGHVISLGLAKMPWGNLKCGFDDGICQCGRGNQAVQHILLTCPAFNNLRRGVWKGERMDIKEKDARGKARDRGSPKPACGAGFSKHTMYGC
ncbi:hypothetical protein CIRG_00159 [Coccidioides immitis RMSCC 2394]|uniref:Reverse transcriptase n=1 Tax=Coccidioides immitis RMSCC 2394 TaxID=404692 RepID=A0A0J7AS34_COCIT|nr:hypothetical protein CIRG_00159 [Coccidioides immitis RMSCC 2394]